jgi:sodium-coupled neutral amino acid transporter 11
MKNEASSISSAAGSKSPFFRPSQKLEFTKTPGGTKHRSKRNPAEEEHKSTILGCSSNLINAIVGSGIVGLPYAVKESGFVAGIFLIVLCGFLTEKSLRLLVETAKHAHVPSYETVAEAAFGRVGFLFIAISECYNVVVIDDDDDDDDDNNDEQRKTTNLC